MSSPKPFLVLAIAGTITVVINLVMRQWISAIGQTGFTLITLSLWLNAKTMIAQHETIKQLERMLLDREDDETEEYGRAVIKEDRP